MRLSNELRSTFGLLASVVACLVSSAEAGGSSIQGLGTVPGASTGLRATSSDGSVIVGSLDFHDGSPTRGFRWTESSGFVVLDAPASAEHTYVKGISPDGSIIVGYATYADPAVAAEALRWIDAGAIMESLGAPTPPANLPSLSKASVALNDGTILGVAAFEDGETLCEPFRWTAVDGMKRIPDPLPDLGCAWINDAAPDGSIMVGGLDGGGYSYPMRWKENEGWSALEGDPGWSNAVSATSDDGKVMAGWVQVDLDTVHAAMWDATGDLTVFPAHSIANDVTPDGRIIVGSPAFIWDEINGVRDLQTVLETDYGIDLGGWTLGGASAISDDGLTILGHGTSPAGDSEIWIARLVEPCPYDLDGDGTVAIGDLLALLGAWGTSPGGPPDVDGDGLVGIGDLLGLLAEWGSCP